MPLKLSCSCGKRFSVADEHAGKRTKCPACGAALTVPAAAIEPAATPPPDVSLDAPSLEGLLDDLPPLGTRLRPPAGHLPTPQSTVTRRTPGKLDNFVLGLTFHYVGMVVLLLSLWAGWIGVALLAGGAGTGIPPQVLESMILTLLKTGGVLAILAAIIEMPGCVLCLTVPDSATRALFACSLALRPVTVLAGVGMLVRAQPQMALWTFLVMLLSWTLWMFGLRQAASYLRDQRLAEEAPRILLGGFVALLLAVVTLFVLVYIAVVLQLIPSQAVRSFSVFALAGIVLVISLGVSSFTGQETWQVMVYPTGITYFLSYLDLITSVRRVAQRES